MKKIPKFGRYCFVRKKISLIFCLCFACNILTLQPVLAFTYSQKADIKFENSSLKEIFKEIKEQMGYTFVFNETLINEAGKVSLTIVSDDIDEIMRKCLEKTKLDYSIQNDVVIIKIKPDNNIQENLKNPITLKGTIRDTEGNTLPGVTIRIEGTTLGTSSDVDGNYAISLPIEKGKLIFSFIGYKTKTIDFNGTQTINLILEEEIEEIDEVVITGMFERRSESFTGSAVTVKREQLLQVGNQNLLRSLSNIDPSFRIMESIEFGSDPNRTPEVQLRGKGSFPDLEGTYSGNPNEPLFILDGFETTVEKIFDLDMNRIETVTILKDAAAKAIYGSKAGNGVVVIETIRPKMGEMRIFYSGSVDLEAPDLTGYNLMNAAEKLRFENEKNMYNATAGTENKQRYEKLYQDRLQDVLRGVDTYWLSKPLKVGVTNKHSLQFEGGDASMRYRAGISYNTIKGVMKGSERNTLTINSMLSYSYKNIVFRNILEFTKNKGINSPYGDFSKYVAMNPYFSPYDSDGNLEPILGYFSNETYYNPLYNAKLKSKSESSYSSVMDNFYIEWNLLTELKLTGRFSYNITKSEQETFLPPDHTNYIKYEELNKKGFYTKGYGDKQSIQSDIGINFSKRLNKHFLFLNGTWNLFDERSISNSYSAEGFGNDLVEDISFAVQYAEATTPSGVDSHTREIGVIGAFNYSFDDRYLFDASYRTTGSSVFGSANRWGQFWSLGAGWNLHHEKFMNKNLFDQLKIRGSIGYTGTQSFTPYQAKARYNYNSFSYDSKYGVYLMALPNEKLKWQRTIDYNLGLDLVFLNIVNVKADYYKSITDDLLLDMSIPYSTGFTTYKENLGKVENNGLDISMSVTPWKNIEKGGWLTVTASGLHNKNKIKKISNSFRRRNELENTNKDEHSYSSPDDAVKRYTRPSTLFYEGQSMSAIWGVRSAGVNPATGREMFYDINGNLAPSWRSADQVIIGDTEPKLSGNIGISGAYMGFTFSLSCSYKFGGDVYNITLIDKVENATGLYNLDKRILKAWTKKGDIAPYKELSIQGYFSSGFSATKPTSRFVQKENELYLSSLNLGYDFYRMDWIKKAGLQRLKLTFYMNELLRLSTIKQERGTSYPFARNFSFSLQATF